MELDKFDSVGWETVGGEETSAPDDFVVVLYHPVGGAGRLKKGVEIEELRVGVGRARAVDTELFENSLDDGTEDMVVGLLYGSDCHVTKIGAGDMGKLYGISAVRVCDIEGVAYP